MSTKLSLLALVAVLLTLAVFGQFLGIVDVPSLVSRKPKRITLSSVEQYTTGFFTFVDNHSSYDFILDDPEKRADAFKTTSHNVTHYRA